MTSAASSPPDWSGDMLDRPEMVEAFARQLRQVLSAQADYVARIRRDAEAMWKANPPDGYHNFEAWWRHRWVRGPFAEIQAHLEKAAKLTFALEARYRRGRHEIPAARQAAAQAKQQLPPLQPLQRRDAVGREPRQERRPAGPGEAPPDGSFLDLIRRDRPA